MTDAARIRALIWDVDGTLSNTHDLCVFGLQHAIVSHGGPMLEPHEVEGLFGPTEEGILASAVPHDADSAMESYVEYYERGHDNGVAFDGVSELVRELAALGVAQGVVTGKGARTAAITIDSLGLSAIFDPVIAGSDAGSIKAQAMAEVLALWGISGSEVAYLGDVPSDVTHARTAGVIPVSVAWKPDADRAALEATSPDALVDSVADLRTWMSTAMALEL